MSFAARAGFHRAVEYALDVGVAAGWERTRGLAASLREMLSTLHGVAVRDRGSVLGGLVTFTVEGTTPTVVQADLRPRGINVSTSTRASAVLDMTERGLEEVVRASVHYYNTSQELETFVGHIARLAADAQRG
jgi:selenocysteine lyase/cysteine desulfurase